MTKGIHSRVFQVSALLAVLVAALLFGSRFFQPFGYAAIPFCWPGLLILGADETQERYGYWGEIILFWLFSLPCIIAYAWLFCRWWQRRRVTHDVASYEGSSVKH
jgi:hypothetical protein